MASTRKSAQPEETLDADEQAFRRQLPRLLKAYRGQFVALSRGRVVGHGSDDEELAARMFEKLGERPFYIAKVERKPTIYELPSPESER